MIKNRPCQRCARETRQEISCRVNANGAECYGWWCLECTGWTMRSDAQGYWISKEELTRCGVDVRVLRVVQRMSQPRCARCGARAAELHHWAPQSIFGKAEADTWPKDYLCVACHEEWHRRVAAAGEIAEF